MPVTLTCMTTKQKFEVSDEDATVVVLKNGRYAYRVPCPWKGKNDKELVAFKFCSAEAYRKWQAAQPKDEAQTSDVEEP